MGRWGTGLYEDDSNLNFLYLHVITPLKHKLAFLLSPEEARTSYNWIIEIMTIVETMLLFDTRALDYELLLHLEISLGMAKRCREIVLKIWDTDWAGDRSKNFNKTQREQDRHILVSWLDRIVEIATLYDIETDLEFDLSDFEPDVTLPYFSLDRLEVRPDVFSDRCGDVIGELLENLAQTVVFYTSPERRKESPYWLVYAPIIVSVDVMAFLCANYKISPSVTVETVDSWQNHFLDICKLADALDSESHRNQMDAFVRLRKVAETYPPNRWS